MAIPSPKKNHFDQSPLASIMACQAPKCYTDAGDLRSPSVPAQRIVGADNATSGHPGRGPGTRELVIPKTPYIVPYRIRGTTIEIARVYHSSRRWPERL